MNGKPAESLRSPESIFVVTVFALLVLISISGMVAPNIESPSQIDAFMHDHSKRYSQFNEELLIRHFFHDERGGTFADIGCAWPVRHSTTCYLERHLGWSGVAVDALDRYREEWEHERPQSRFRQYAVSDQSGGTITFYEAAWPGVSSLSKHHATKFTGVEPAPIEVPAITLTDLLENEGIASIDFLSLDIEGAELFALAGFDIERYGPRLVCVEGRGRDNANEVYAYFDEHGYLPVKAYEPYDKINYYFAKRSH